MAETTTRPNFFQLRGDMGVSADTPFTMDGPDEDGVYVITSPDVDDAVLAAALDEHDPNPAIVPPPSPAEVEAAAKAEKVRTVEDDVDTLRQWAVDAAALTQRPTAISAAEHKEIVRRLGIFFDRFADYVEGKR